mmetsp:Transcript_57943/g.124477  ORF Transcript_57943/g.124477 Transcript_57943/m.124477 type:complete len:231 (-) Transcript_57943:2430-3122(-)
MLRIVIKKRIAKHLDELIRLKHPVSVDVHHRKVFVQLPRRNIEAQLLFEVFAQVVASEPRVRDLIHQEKRRARLEDAIAALVKLGEGIGQQGQCEVPHGAPGHRAHHDLAHSRRPEAVAHPNIQGDTQIRELPELPLIVIWIQRTRLKDLLQQDVVGDMALQHLLDDSLELAECAPLECLEVILHEPDTQQRQAHKMRAVRCVLRLPLEALVEEIHVVGDAIHEPEEVQC